MSLLNPDPHNRSCSYPDPYLSQEGVIVSCFTFLKGEFFISIVLWFPQAFIKRINFFLYSESSGQFNKDNLTGFAIGKPRNKNFSTSDNFFYLHNFWTKRAIVFAKYCNKSVKNDFANLQNNLIWLWYFALRSSVKHVILSIGKKI